MPTHTCVIYLLFKMAAKEVYRKATVINNKATKFHKQKMKSKIPLLNKKVKLRIATKTVVFWTYFEINNSENNKTICLTCKEKISRGGNKPTKFNRNYIMWSSMYLFQIKMISKH